MKVFFDTSVYVAEALLGDAAARMLKATARASWRVFSSPHVLDEIERVMVERLGFSRRFALLTSRRVQRLLSLSPYEGLRILSMSDYYRLLRDHQLLA